MHGLDPMPPRRAIVSWVPDPQDVQRRLYELDCGHVVSRRTRGDKRSACCDRCTIGTPLERRSWRNPIP